MCSKCGHLVCLCSLRATGSMGWCTSHRRVRQPGEPYVHAAQVACLLLGIPVRRQCCQRGSAARVPCRGSTLLMLHRCERRSRITCTWGRRTLTRIAFRPSRRCWRWETQARRGFVLHSFYLLLAQPGSSSSRGGTTPTPLCPPHLPGAVWVKVVEVTEDERGFRVGCSIKLAGQSDGTDLDPSNTKYRPRGEGPGAPRVRAAPAASQLACLPACSKAGGWLLRLGAQRLLCSIWCCHPWLAPPPSSPGKQVQQPIGAHVAEAHGGAVDWGYLKADVVQVGKAAAALRLRLAPHPPTAPPAHAASLCSSTRPVAVRQGQQAVRPGGG